MVEHRFKTAGTTASWLGCRTDFETSLYGIPFWNIHLEIYSDDISRLAHVFSDPGSLERVGECLQKLIEEMCGDGAYVSTRVVCGTPLSEVLANAGFEPVEHRRLYVGRISTLRRLLKGRPAEGIAFARLNDFDLTTQSQFKEEMLQVCKVVFNGKGYSRYFQDPLLINRRPGLDYILAVMELNYTHVNPEHIFMAVDEGSGHPVGFSVVGQKPCLFGATHSQLLSAVLPSHQGRGLYYGLTRIMAETMSGRTRLLNVTHAQNIAIQRAYRNSGRYRLADTLVYRSFKSA